MSKLSVTGTFWTPLHSTGKHIHTHTETHLQWQRRKGNRTGHLYSSSVVTSPHKSGSSPSPLPGPGVTWAIVWVQSPQSLSQTVLWAQWLSLDLASSASLGHSEHHPSGSDRSWSCPLPHPQQDLSNVPKCRWTQGHGVYLIYSESDIKQWADRTNLRAGQESQAY